MTAGRGWLLLALAAGVGAAFAASTWREDTPDPPTPPSGPTVVTSPTPVPGISVEAVRLEAGQRTIAEAIAWSEHHGDYAIVIDKSAYTLLAYKDGLEVGRWPVELGGDPLGAKQRHGDQRTPEGLYSVTWRREQGHTRFYRALLLDYPNTRDRAAGRTGSHIEIHGMGSGRRPGEGGFNWTLGCIALSNGDIDELLGLGDDERRVAEGTPVTIVYAGTLPSERYEVTQKPGSS